MAEPIMQLDRDQNPGLFIRGVVEGRIVIGDDAFTRPLIVTATQLVADWNPPPVGALTIVHLQAVLDLDPEVILLGTGVRQVFPPLALTTSVLRRGVGLEVMATPAACRTFNVLAGEYRRVAAALYID
jgi:uncharacterized protein